jgi:hypothetical protein
MDLLFGQILKNQSAPSNKKYDDNLSHACELIDEFPADALSAEIAAKIRAVAKDYITAYYAVRYHHSLDTAAVDALGAQLDQFKKDPATADFTRGVATVMHVLKRMGTDSPYRWPIHYLDVYPALQDDWRTFLDHVMDRDRKIAEGAPAELAQPPSIRLAEYSLKGFHTNFDELCKTGTGNIGHDAARVCECKALTFVQECGETLLSELKDTGNRLVFVFDPQREIKPILYKKPANHIYFFDLLYRFFGWAITEKHVSKYLPTVLNNLKIAKTLIYEIYLYVIPRAKSDLYVHFNDNAVTGISYLFVKLGASICTRNVEMVFNGKIDDRSDPRKWNRYEYRRASRVSMPMPKGISVADVISLEAFYFTYYHEIFRANHKKGEKAPPLVMAEGGTVINELSQKDYGLFHKLCRLREEVAAYIKSIAGGLPRVRQEDIDYAARDYYAKAIVGLTKVDKPKLTILAAPPGTGKSFYIKKYAKNIALVVSDDIGESYPLSGITRDDIIRDYRDSSQGIFGLIDKSDVPSEIKPVLKTTFYSDQRRILTKAHKELGIAAKEPLVTKLLNDNFNTLLEESELAVGGTNADNFPTAMDSCGNIADITTRVSFYVNLFPNVDYEIVMVYIHPIKEYNQQLARYLESNRLMRFYEIYHYNLGIWKNINETMKEHLSVISFGDNGEEYRFFSGMKINMDEVERYGEKYIFDGLFANFLSNISGIDKSRFPMSGQVRYLRW